jgi:hypothetical protein
MSEQMFDDLGAWEAGTLSLAELEHAHGREPILAIVALHESLISIVSEPVPDASAGWLKVLEQLDARRPAKSLRVHRAFAGALVAAVLSASAAFAAPGAFHAIVDGVRHGVHAVFGGNDGRTHVPPSSGPTDHRPGAGPSSSDTTGKGSDGGGSDAHGGGSGSGSGDQGSGSGDQGSGNQGTGSGDQGSGSGDQGTGSGDQGSGSGDQGSTSTSGDQGAASRASGSGNRAGDGGSGSDGSSGS